MIIFEIIEYELQFSLNFQMLILQFVFNFVVTILQRKVLFFQNFYFLELFILSNDLPLNLYMLGLYYLKYIILIVILKITLRSDFFFIQYFQNYKYNQFLLLNQMENYFNWQMNQQQLFFYNQHFNQFQMEAFLRMHTPIFHQYPPLFSDQKKSSGSSVFINQDLNQSKTRFQTADSNQTERKIKKQQKQLCPSVNKIRKNIQQVDKSIISEKQCQNEYFLTQKQINNDSESQYKIRDNSFDSRKFCDSILLKGDKYNEKLLSYKLKSNLREKNSAQISIAMQYSKELIIFILNDEPHTKQDYSSIKRQIAEEINRSFNRNIKTVNLFLDQLIQILSTKMSKFKKTKQQMIKYIFRKIFNGKSKPEQMCQLRWRIASKIHQKNSSGFKSMNMKYVQTQFQNPIFVEMFQNFIQNFEDNFAKQNNERIDRLNSIVTEAIITKDLSQLKSYRKMPWNAKIKKSIESLFQDLNEIKRNTVYPEGMIDKLIEQFKIGYAAQYEQWRKSQANLKKVQMDDK